MASLRSSARRTLPLIVAELSRALSSQSHSAGAIMFRHATRLPRAGTGAVYAVRYAAARCCPLFIPQPRGPLRRTVPTITPTRICVFIVLLLVLGRGPTRRCGGVALGAVTHAGAAWPHATDRERAQ